MKPSSHSSEQTAVRCTIMRGGTSKGIFFLEDDLPADSETRDRLFLAAMGSPDPRQIDGLGGADNLTSKIVVVGKNHDSSADVTYTFGQVGIDLPYVSYSANCGNLSAAVGAYAIQEGIIAGVDPITTVRIFNTNTCQLLITHVPVSHGMPLVKGDYAIAGVPGTGAEVRLDFARTKGATTGKMLPSGHSIDELFVPELGKTIQVSFVDVAKVTMYFHARDAGIRGTETPDEFTPEILGRFWAIRNAGAKHIGLAPDSRLPHPVSVIAPEDYLNHMTKALVHASEVSFVARRVGGPPPRLHKAFAATGAVCTAVAANLPGTIVHQVTRQFNDGIVRIGHPTGVFPVRIRMDSGENIIEASYSRTARRIMDGLVYIDSDIVA